MTERPAAIEQRADFSGIRYGQCWEDADILLDALNIGSESVCLSIASAGDNTLSLLSRGPRRVIAVDLSPAQLACLELRVAAFKSLTHSELLEFSGSTQSLRRLDLYARCRSHLAPSAQQFWDDKRGLLEQGFVAAGKFERYFEVFRHRVLPLVHGRRHVEELLRGGEPTARQRFYAATWDTWRWRLLFRFFFSRFMMGRIGRDPAFFDYVEGSVADRILARTRYALTELDPAQNPYLEFILTGKFRRTLPHALRAENFDAIRSNLDRLEWRCEPLDRLLAGLEPASIDAFNLSDIFEYMPEPAYHSLLAALVRSGRKGARLAYWNMLVPRRRPASLAAQLSPLTALAGRLAAEDKAFFYSAFVVEEVL
jgi:S-adenosylmethionine-diacylglycerol 3-amino-3-carboxypropyl transferase